MNENDKLYKKYAGAFKYGSKIAYPYYLKRRNEFKQIPMDWNDVSQEILLAIWKAVKPYENKYKGVKFVNKEGETKEVYFLKYVKGLVINTLHNILRDNAKKSFYAIDKEDELEDLDWETKEIDDREEEYDFENMKKSNRYKKGIILNKKDIEESMKEKGERDILFDSASKDSIENILKTYSNSDNQFEIVCMRVLDNLTFKEISEKLNISRSRACSVYNKIIARMKENKDKILNEF
jgi:RNA polymerase sigma factor (sigma-70 family)